MNESSKIIVKAKKRPKWSAGWCTVWNDCADTTHGSSMIWDYIGHHSSTPDWSHSAAHWATILFSSIEILRTLIKRYLLVATFVQVNRVWQVQLSISTRSKIFQIIPQRQIYHLLSYTTFSPETSRSQLNAQRLYQSITPRPLWNLSILTTDTCLARIIWPTKTNIINPPNLMNSSNCQSRADDIKIGEAFHTNWSERTFDQLRTCWNRDRLRRNLIQNTRCGLTVLISWDCEQTSGGTRVAAERSTVKIKAETSITTFVSSTDVASETIFPRIWSNLVVGRVYANIGNEVEEQRFRWGKVGDSRWRDDRETVREDETVVWIEERQWLNIVDTLVANW